MKKKQYRTKRLGIASSFDFLNLEEGWMGQNENSKKHLAEDFGNEDSVNDTLQFSNDNNEELVATLSENEIDDKDPDFHCSTPIKADDKKLHKDYNMNILQKINMNARERIRKKEGNRIKNLSKKTVFNKKKTAKYTGACPDFVSLHEQNTNHRKKLSSRYLKNTKILGGTVTVTTKASNKQTEKKIFILENSSVFDCIFEIFAFAYKNLKTFQAYCDDEIYDPKSDLKKNSFLYNVVKWSNSANFQSTYAYRDRMFLTHGKREKATISIQEKPSELFVLLMGSESFSVQEKLLCANCGETEKLANLIQLKDTQNIIKDLQKGILEELKNNPSNCQACLGAAKKVATK